MPRLLGMELDVANLPAVLLPSEVAELLRVDHSTVLRWIRNGDLDATRLPGGTYRVPRHLVQALMAANAAPDAA